MDIFKLFPNDIINHYVAQKIPKKFLCVNKEHYLALFKIIIRDKSNKFERYRFILFETAHFNLLQILCNNGKTDLVKLLLSRGDIDPTKDDNRAIRIAARNNDISIVKILLEDSRVRMYSGFREAIEVSINKKNIEIFKILSSERKDCLADYLNIAVLNRSLEIVRFILDDPIIEKYDIERALVSSFSSSFYRHIETAIEIIKLLLLDKRLTYINAYTIGKLFKIQNDSINEINEILISDPRVILDNDILKCAIEYGNANFIDKILLETNTSYKIDLNKNIKEKIKDIAIQAIILEDYNILVSCGRYLSKFLIHK